MYRAKVSTAGAAWPMDAISSEYLNVPSRRSRRISRWPWMRYTSVGLTATGRTNPGGRAGVYVQITSPALRNDRGLSSAWTATRVPEWSWMNTWSSNGWTVAIPSARPATGAYSRQAVTRLSRARSSAAGSRARVVTDIGVWAEAAAATSKADRTVGRRGMMRIPPGAGADGERRRV